MSAAACDLELLEALAFDELPLDQARRALEHACACPSCGVELASLQKDRARFHHRAAAQPALHRLELFARVESRALASDRRQRIRREVAAFALCAASLLCVVGLSARSADPGLQLGATVSSATECPPGAGPCGLASVDEIGRLENEIGACLVATPADCR